MKTRKPPPERSEADLRSEEDQWREVFTRWLNESAEVIAIFQNQALDSAMCGQKIALRYSYDAIGTVMAERQHVTAPDSRVGPGWKYVLYSLHGTVDSAVACLKERL